MNLRYILKDTKVALSFPINGYTSKSFVDKTISKLSRKKSAFTLAETLITLTIIGVIAAMTVPTLMTNYQKQVYVTGLKKIYSQLQNAMRMMPITENCGAGDYDCVGIFEIGSNGAKVMNGEAQTEILAKQFKTVKVLLTEDKYKNDPGCEEMSKIGSHSYGAGSGIPCFYTADGMVLSSTNGIYVDLNGPKGPNIMGRDQFAFVLAEPHNNANIPAGTVMPMGSKLYARHNNNNNSYWKTGKQCESSNLKKSKSCWDVGHCTGRVLEEGKMDY